MEILGHFFNKNMMISITKRVSNFWNHNFIEYESRNGRRKIITRRELRKY